jgi:ubiquinone/menaquinone biosynthesis C-methylase UbiE
MPKRTEMLRAGQYFLAVEGLALIRTTLIDPSAGLARVEEIRSIVEGYDEFPNSLEIPMSEYDVDEGYDEWAPRYDGPNPAIETEEPIVHAVLERLPCGTALDAACGTGRHAAHLARLGHDVIGVDGNDTMLAVARAKVPAADFRQGRLEALPVDDASVDLVTCALALTHVPDLRPVMAEVARVLRPGGHAVLSDVHPLTTMTGGIAGFPAGDVTGGIPYVVNRTHHVSEYIAAFGAAGLSIVECIEPRVIEDRLDTFPSYPVLPEATRQAFLGMPYLLVWHLRHDAVR